MLQLVLFICFILLRNSIIWIDKQPSNCIMSGLTSRAFSYYHVRTDKQSLPILSCQDWQAEPSHIIMSGLTSRAFPYYLVRIDKQSLPIVSCQDWQTQLHHSILSGLLTSWALPNYLARQDWQAGFFHIIVPWIISLVLPYNLTMNNKPGFAILSYHD
jgi:hypothetical protein